MRNVLMVVGLLLFGCQRADKAFDATENNQAQPTATESDWRATMPPTSEKTVPTPATSPASTPRSPTRAAETLWKANVDLDGDGKPEKIRLLSSEVRTQGSERADEEAAIPVRGCENGAASCTAVLKVGEGERQLSLSAGYFGGIDLSTIDIDAKDGRKELLYRRRASGHVDPPFIFTVGIYDGKQLHWQELDAADGYDAGKIKAPGNGVLTTEYDACFEVKLATYRLTTTGLRKINSTTKQVRDPNQCAACPFVYVKLDNTFVRQGEILRNLSSAALNAHQSLPLNISGVDRLNGFVHVQLREEKPETTYLDSVWLSADGIDYAPRACGRQTYCTSDGIFHRIAPGEKLDLYFTVPPTAEQIRLEAVGHYVPHDNR